MASTKKFTDDAVCNMLRHNGRQIIENSNPDIDSSKSVRNYSFLMDHGELTDYEYYQKIKAEKYLYGRGTSREKSAVTAAGWVVTCPKEILGDAEKEKAFFRGVYHFVSIRYGSENIINNAVHYDEGGSPHIHIIFVPTTKLDHDQVHFKTQKTKMVTKTETGRYEYSYRFIRNKNGERIPLKNYARMSDYYDEKISAADVINKAELQHFHQDLQAYLSKHSIEGAVLNGATGGNNMTVKSLKDFTRKTGLTLDDIRDIQMNREELQMDKRQVTHEAELQQIIQEKNTVIESLKEEILSKDSLIDSMQNKSDEMSHKDAQIRNLSHIISELNQELTNIENHNSELEKKVAEIENALEAKQKELERAQARVEEIEKAKIIEFSKADNSQGWGHSSQSSWGEKSQSGWGNRTTTIDEEKTW